MTCTNSESKQPSKRRYTELRSFKQRYCAQSNAQARSSVVSSIKNTQHTEWYPSNYINGISDLFLLQFLQIIHFLLRFCAARFPFNLCDTGTQQHTGVSVKSQVNTLYTANRKHLAAVTSPGSSHVTADMRTRRRYRRPRRWRHLSNDAVV